MAVKYEWTGEYRIPKAGEWFIGTSVMVPWQAAEHETWEGNYWILRRVDDGQEAHDGE